MLKKKISRVFLIITGIAALQIIGTIIIGRNLTKSDMGLWRLLLNIAELSSLISLLGLDQSFVRFFSSPKASFAEYDWKAFLRKYFFISFSITVLVNIIACRIYQLGALALLFTTITASMVALIFIFSSFLRAMQKYEVAIFFNRMNFVLFFIFLMFIFIGKNISLLNLFVFYAVATVAANLSIIYYTFKKIPCGRKPIPLSIIKNGAYYFLSGVSIILMPQAGPFIIAKALSLKDLAVYTVTLSIMRIFEFIQDSCYHVLAPHLNARKPGSTKKIFSFLIFIAIITGVFYALFGKILLNFLFNGLYNEGFKLIPIFILIGIIRLLYSFPASIIGGRSSEGALKKQTIGMAIVSALNIILGLILIPKWGLEGAAIASLISWLLLFVMTLFITKRYFLNENDYEL